MFDTHYTQYVPRQDTYSTKYILNTQYTLPLTGVASSPRVCHIHIY